MGDKAVSTYQAFILNSKVANLLVCDDNFAAIVVAKFGYDSAVNVTALNPMPGPGWNYDGSKFSPPQTESFDTSGVATLVNGKTTVSNIGITNDDWFIAVEAIGGGLGSVSSTNIVDNVSFDIVSTDPIDTREVKWVMLPVS